MSTSTTTATSDYQEIYCGNTCGNCPTNICRGGRKFDYTISISNTLGGDASVYINCLIAITVAAFAGGAETTLSPLRINRNESSPDP
jgi:hypothetical protein